MKGKLSPRLGRVWEGMRGFAGRHRSWIWRAGAGASVALIVLLVHRSAYTLVKAQPDFRVRSQASAKVAPDWASGECLVTLPPEMNLMDDSLVERVGRTFEESPWVRKVTAVERVFPDSLRVRFQARRPHVAVRRAEGVYLVDSDGVRLPGVYASVPPCERTVEIAGSVSTPPAAGQKWTHAEIRAGVELAGLVAASPALRALDIKSVDVSNVDGRSDRRLPETSLVTSRGCVIHWGRPPSSARFGEASSEEKLARLAEVVRDYPDLAGVRYVKVHAGPRAAVAPLETSVTRQRTPR